MASKIKVLNIGAFDQPHDDSWIYNDVVSFHNLFSQYENMNIESYYFSYFDYVGNYDKIIDLIQNLDVYDYDAVVYLIHGHGSYHDNAYHFQVDGSKGNQGSRYQITDAELLTLIASKQKCSVLIVNTCEAIFEKNKLNKDKIFSQPFIRENQQNLNNSLKIIKLLYNNEFNEEQDNILAFEDNCSILIFSFSTNSTTFRNDGIKSYAGSIADMFAVCNSRLTILNIMEISKSYLEKSDGDYKTVFNPFGTNLKNGILNTEIEFYLMKEMRRNIYRSVEIIVHQNATQVLND